MQLGSALLGTLQPPSPRTPAAPRRSPCGLSGAPSTVTQPPTPRAHPLVPRAPQAQHSPASPILAVQSCLASAAFVPRLEQEEESQTGCLSGWSVGTIRL